MTIQFISKQNEGLLSLAPICLVWQRSSLQLVLPGSHASWDGRDTGLEAPSSQTCAALAFARPGMGPGLPHPTAAWAWMLRLSWGCRQLFEPIRHPSAVSCPQQGGDGCFPARADLPVENSLGRGLAGGEGMLPPSPLLCVLLQLVLEPGSVLQTDSPHPGPNPS